MDTDENISAEQQDSSQFQQDSSNDAQLLGGRDELSGIDTLNGADAAAVTDIGPLGQALAADNLSLAVDNDTTAQADTLLSQLLAVDQADDITASPVDELAAALAAGDIVGAQNAFENLQQIASPNFDVPDPAPVTPETIDFENTDATNPFADRFASLNEALDSGDLIAARNASAQLAAEVANDPLRPPLGGLATGLDNSDQADAVQSTFSELANALNSGDIDGAQDALQSLRDEVQAQQGNRFASDYSQIATLTSTTTTSLSISV
jgi:hypothetical protein